MEMFYAFHWKSKLPQYVVYFNDKNNPERYIEVSSIMDAIWWMQNYVPVQPVAQTP
jgi:hypothetical protein